MPSSNSTMIKKLQRAINEKFGQKLLFNKTEFYSEQQDRPVTVYSVKQAVWDEKKKRTVSVELFKSTSEIQIVLWLRDKWYELNGWYIPTDNEAWEKAKEQYKKKRGGE